MARPTKYSDALGKRIYYRMCAGDSVKRIARSKSMPTARTIFLWAMDEKHEFFHLYNRAKRIRAETLIDEMIDIADDDTGDYHVVKIKGVRATKRHAARPARTELRSKPLKLQRDKERISTRKWLAARAIPSLYGNRVQFGDEEGKGGVTIVLNESGQSDQKD